MTRVAEGTAEGLGVGDGVNVGAAGGRAVGVDACRLHAKSIVTRKLAVRMERIIFLLKIKGDHLVAYFTVTVKVTSCCGSTGPFEGG